jgi:hypothetical protein
VQSAPVRSALVPVAGPSAGGAWRSLTHRVAAMEASASRMPGSNIMPKKEGFSVLVGIIERWDLVTVSRLLVLAATQPAHGGGVTGSLTSGHMFWIGVTIGLLVGLIPLIPWAQVSASRVLLPAEVHEEPAPVLGVLFDPVVQGFDLLLIQEPQHVLL